MQRALAIKPEATFNYVSVPIGYICVALYANAFYPPGAATMVSFAYIVIYLLTNKFAVPRDIGQYLSIPLLLFVIGIIGSSDHLFYDVFKDVWYFINPPITLCAGYFAMNRIKRIEPVLNTFILGGLLLSVHYLINLFSDIPFLLNASIHQLHARKGGGHFLSVLSLAAFLIAHRRGIVLFHGRFSPKLINAGIFINAAAVFLSFYRASWLSLMILVLFGAGFFTLKKLFRGLAVVAVIVAFFQIVVLVTPEDRLTSNTILGKIVLSLDEVIMRDYSRIVDMQAHWRGYESYMALQTYLDGNFFNILVGHGFGRLVDLKVVMVLSKENYRYIPILHNGYMYLLVKTGLLGLVLHLIYLYRLIQFGANYVTDSDTHLVFAGYFIMAMPMVLLLTTFFTAGMFNKDLFYSLMLLLGCFLAYARIRKVKPKGGDAI